MGEERTNYFEVKKNQPRKYEINKTWEGELYSWDIVKLKDGSYVGIRGIDPILTIRAEDTVDNQEIELIAIEEEADIAIIKYNSNLKVEYVKQIGADGWDWINDIVSTKDGGYVITGKIIGQVSIENGEVRVSTENGEKGVVDCYIYNDKGQHVETKYFDDGQIDYDTCYKYDENGNCIEVNTDDYRLDGIVVKIRNVSVFDENNREIERIKYEGLTEETEKEVYFYNKNGDLKEIQNIDIETGEIISRDLYCYDTDGKLSEILTYEGSDVMGKWTYSYNQQGKETECRIYDGLGNLTHKHVSIYDERGSFCGTKKYKNGILVFSYLDEIEYYD